MNQTTTTTPAMTTVPNNLPADQIPLAEAWIARCTRGEFSDAVQGVGTIRVFGRAGDAPVTFPRIKTLAALDALAPDERWAAQYASDVVVGHQRDHRPIFAAQPGQGAAGDQIVTFDVTTTYDILVLSPITGG